MFIKPTPDQIKSWIKINFPIFKSARHGQEIRINNPFQSPVEPDTGFHLWINLEKAKVHDFRPQYKRQADGSFLWFVKKYKRTSFRQAVREVMGDGAINSISYDGKMQIYEEKNRIIYVKLPEGFVRLDDNKDDPISKPVREYLYSRCVTDEQISALEIGNSGFDVVFPYHEYGEIVYWQSRSAINKRFNFPEGTSKTQYIYGFDNIEPDEPVIVTESIFNSMMFDRGVSAGGSSISVEQKRRFKAAKASILIITFDNDEAGWKGTAQAYDLLKSDFKLYYSLPDGDDDWNKIAQNNGIKAVRSMMIRNLRKLDLSNVVKLKLRQR